MRSHSILAIGACQSVDCQAVYIVNNVMDARQIIGWNLRKLRVGRGLSQERLAFEAQIDRSYVGRVERGSENVTISTLEALANALGVGVPELFAVPDKDAPQPLPMRAGRKLKP